MATAGELTWAGGGSGPASSLHTGIYPESSSALGKGRRRNQPLGGFCCRTFGGNSTCG